MSARGRLGQVAFHSLGLLRALLPGTAGAGGQAARSRFAVFLAPEALAINQARQAHLASLGLDLTGRSVLEVGAGIGLHTPFFLKRGCRVLATDGNPENVAEIRRRHPGLEARVLDLEQDQDLRSLGRFDVVYCYGLLYHLARPEQALAQLAQACSGQVLLESCVSPGGFDEVLFVRDPASNNQALGGIGCRPTRCWVHNRLRRYFGHGYLARTQPDHPDFPENWDCPETQLVYRAVFVGSRAPLALATLTEEIPRSQPKYRDGA